MENVISVMAIDNTGAMYDISGYGSNADVAAPGKKIYVLLPEGETTYVNGTSAATAFVTAIAALMKSHNDELTPCEIKQILIETSQKIDLLKGICASGGCVDAYAAVKNCN